jgi:hypothetical protein
MSPEYDGYYHQLKNFLEGNRPVFEMTGNCVWWHQQYRHWWVGPCENVGLNSGYAYAKEDVDCPSDEQTWRRGGSDEFLNGVHVSLSQSFAAPAPEASAVLLDETSPTAPVNAIIRNGRYKQTCRPVYKNGKFKCS